MQDDDILKRIRNETPYLADDGFSQKVLEKLPKARRYRQWVLGASWALALILGLTFWVSGGRGLTVFSFEPAVLLSAATLCFWAVLGLFVFVAKDEGLLDI